MLLFPASRKPSYGQIFLLALVLAAQLTGLVELHAEHGLAGSASSSVEIHPEACHPGTALHVEASGPGRHVHPCHACFHGVRSLSVASAVPPRIAPPVPPSLPLSETAVLPGTRDAVSSAGSRAPPRLS